MKPRRWWSTPSVRAWRILSAALDYCGPLWQIDDAEVLWRLVTLEQHILSDQDIRG